MTQETEITTMSEKGQVVIPQTIRKKLKIKPKTKLLVSAKDDVIIMKAFELPDIESEWAKVFASSDKKNLQLSEKEVYDEIQAHRAKKKRKA